MSGKPKTETIGSYLLSKNGETKYIKLEASPKADAATKEKVARLIEANGGDVLFVNIHDEDFRVKYNVPDFVKGRIASPTEGTVSAPKTKAPANDDPVNF
jgi:hypothetical protein